MKMRVNFHPNFLGSKAPCDAAAKDIFRKAPHAAAAGSVLILKRRAGEERKEGEGSVV